VKQAFVQSARRLLHFRSERSAQHRAGDGEEPAASGAYCPVGLHGETEIFAVRHDTHARAPSVRPPPRRMAKRLRLDVGFEPAGMAEDGFARSEFLCRPWHREDGIVRGEHHGTTRVPSFSARSTTAVKIACSSGAKFRVGPYGHELALHLRA
jgi:hypothetical protein